LLGVAFLGRWGASAGSAPGFAHLSGKTSFDVGARKKRKLGSLRPI
jgi:hypothetical protein